MPKKLELLISVSVSLTFHLSRTFVQYEPLFRGHVPTYTYYLVNT